MVWYYADGDRQRGPISEQEFQEMVANGRIHRQTLVWSDSMENWQTLDEAREAGLVKIQPASPSVFTPEFPAPPPPGGAPADAPTAEPATAADASGEPAHPRADAYCTQCGRGPLGLYDEVKLGQLTLCPECDADLAQYYQSQRAAAGIAPAGPFANNDPASERAQQTESATTESQTVYQTAALIPRIAAKMIDNMLVSVVMFLAMSLTANVSEVNALTDQLVEAWRSGDTDAFGTIYRSLAEMTLPAVLIGTAFAVLYNAILVATVGATLGKMLFRIRVVTAHGMPVRFGQALLRALLPVIANNAGQLSAILLPIVYGSALIDPFRRTVVDHLAKTRVVKPQR